MKKITFSVIITLAVLGMDLVPVARTYAQDSLTISGKGMYLWQLWSSPGNNLPATIAKLKSIGATWVVIKMADGDSYYNVSGKSLYSWASSNYGSMDSVVSVFHSNGIKLFAFQYVYGVPHHWGNPQSETDVANWILDVKGIDGLLIDAEIQYDTLTNRAAVAAAYCDSIRAHHPDAFIGLTAWARVTGHTTFPWQAFLDRVVVNMTQTYWAARPITPASELNLMSTQFSQYTNLWVSQGDTLANKPIMPIGQGEYFGYSSDVKQGEVASFCNLSQSTYHYPGVSLWEYNQISHSYVFDEYAAAWSLTSVKNSIETPNVFSLSQNFPNPFNPSTTFQYSVPVRSFVSITIYDILGRKIADLVAREMSSGMHTVTWDAAHRESGVYFCRLHTGSFSETRKIILLK